MRIYCISGDPNYPCYVVTVRGCTIMLDCSLNMRSLQYFLPQMLVPSQRFENAPNFRSTFNGVPFANVKEFNSRPFLNSPLEFSLPNFDLINIQDVDVVLISNYHTMLALPYLTRMPEFRASVYCTEPTLHFGRMFMEEMTNFIRTNQSMIIVDNKDKSVHVASGSGDENTDETTVKNKASKRNLAAVEQNQQQQQSDSVQEKKRALAKKEEEIGLLIRDDELDQKLQSLDWKDHKIYIGQLFNITESHFKPLNWQTLYTREDVDSCISKIKLVSFNEEINVFGSIIACPKSSGHSIGSCNWIIEASADYIHYLSRSNMDSTNSHPKSFDQTFFRNQVIDSLIVSGLNQVPSTQSDSMMKELCRAAIMTVKKQGSVLIPTYPTGKIYDILEMLNAALGEASLGSVPIYFISSVAQQSLAYSNIFAEWLCEPRLNATYSAEAPFQHSDLVKNGFLKVFPGINGKFNDEYRQPCIIFASHPSLRFGDVVHLIELWKTSPNNAFIFIEPEFNYLDALAPYQPVYASYYYFPIDRALTPDRLFKSLNETRAINQIIASNYYKTLLNVNASVNEQQNSSKLVKSENNITFHSQNEIVKVSTRRRYENCEIEPDLAAMIVPNKSSGNNSVLAFATFNAELITRNNHHVLKAAPRTIPLNRRDRINESHLKKYAYGKLSLAKFLNSMKHFGINPAKFNGKNFDTSLEKELLLENEFMSSSGLPQVYSIEIDAANRVDLNLNTNQINITTDSEELRMKLRDCLLKCINTI